MKKLPLLVSLLFVVFLSSCYEDYKFDFEHTATYFSRQYPLRTVIVEEGEDLKFDVGVVLGGKYKNEATETVKFHVEPSLLTEYPALKILPEAYYELSNTSEISIPSGSFVGSVTVNLKPAFIQDAEAMSAVYALPLMIDKEGTTLDSVLVDKDFTIVVVKYINKYHGGYWLKGVDNTLDDAGAIVSTEEYKNTDLVLNKDVVLTTMGEHKLLVPHVGYSESGDTSPEQFSMLLSVTDETGVLTANENSEIKTLTGTATYDKSTRNFMFTYEYTDGDAKKHTVTDELIYRDTRLAIEHWN